MDSTADSHQNRLLPKTFEFSVRNVKLCQYIYEEYRSFRAISNQLIRSGTSIGANIEEARGAQSRPDFITKYHIALKEAHETSYWLRILIETSPKLEKRVIDLLSKCEEIKKILGASLVTLKTKDK